MFSHDLKWIVYLKHTKNHTAVDVSRHFDIFEISFCMFLFYFINFFSSSRSDIVIFLYFLLHLELNSFCSYFFILLFCLSFLCFIYESNYAVLVMIRGNFVMWNKLNFFLLSSCFSLEHKIRWEEILSGL